MPLANRCCGDPACQYGSRQPRPPMASRPRDPRSRWVDGGSTVLAVLAFGFVVVLAGSVGVRWL